MRKQKAFVLPLFFLFFLFLSAVPFARASSHLPHGLLVAQEYQHEQAQHFLFNVSFFIAFLAGIVTLLSPCLLPLIPAFFSYTFKEKKQITFMTLIFFSGFTLMFVAMGVTAAMIGNVSLAILQENNTLFIQIAGAAMIFFGFLSLLGKGFSGLIFRKKTGHDTLGVFMYGLFFAIGWTACIGPILAGVLSMTAVFHNYFTAVILMFFYSLGIFVPIFIFCFFYDGHHLEKMKWMEGKTYFFNIFGKEHCIHTSNLIAGILFIIIGLIFVIFKGTGIVNGTTYFGIKDVFYTFQRYLLQGGWIFNVIGFIVLFLIVYNIYKAITTKKS